MGAKGGAGEPRIVGLSILIMRVYAWGSPVIGSERGISLESINNSMHSMMAMGLRRCGKLTYYLRQYKRLPGGFNEIELSHYQRQSGKKICSEKFHWQESHRSTGLWHSIYSLLLVLDMGYYRRSLISFCTPYGKFQVHFGHVARIFGVAIRIFTDRKHIVFMPLIRHMVSSHLSRRMMDLTLIGPVVRIAPNTLSFSNPSVVRDIYMSKLFVKEESFYVSNFLKLSTIESLWHKVLTTSSESQKNFS
jgi:hypothetical protein